jgi:hypothetical protein
MASMWNRSIYLLCLLHLRRRRRRKRREREFWEHPIVAARTLEGAYYTLDARLREDDRKFFNYFRMSTSTFDYIVDRLAPHFERQNTDTDRDTDGVKCGEEGPKWLNAGLFIEGFAGIAPTCRRSSR